ncbi:espin [Sesbania bispinosa]|nr:espin [Sesbania bispinosa]
MLSAAATTHLVQESGEGAVVFDEERWRLDFTAFMQWSHDLFPWSHDLRPVVAQLGRVVQRTETVDEQPVKIRFDGLWRGGGGYQVAAILEAIGFQNCALSLRTARAMDVEGQLVVVGKGLEGEKSSRRKDAAASQNHNMATKSKVAEGLRKRVQPKVGTTWFLDKRAQQKVGGPKAAMGQGQGQVNLKSPTEAGVGQSQGQGHLRRSVRKADVGQNQTAEPKPNKL